MDSMPDSRVDSEPFVTCQKYGTIKSASRPAAKYIRYKSRWFRLLVIMIFNMSNSMQWISYAPVANVAAVYYKVTETKINWFSFVFFICTVVCGLPAFWVIDTLGLRTGALVGTWLNASGSVFRVIASYIAEDGNRYWIALIGQILCACSQTLVVSVPTKLAALWFADNERTIANTFASLAAPFGVLLANALTPVIVKKPSDILLMLQIYSVPCCLAAALATVGFCSSKPPTPPSASAEEESDSFFKGIKQIRRNKPFLLLMFTFGTGAAIFSTMATLLEQIVCVKGYNNKIAGLCGALVILGGIIGAAISAIYCDRTKKFEETVKVMVLFLGLALCGVLVITSFYDETVLLCICFFFAGATALGVAPVCMELGVECTYPVAEATSSGLQWLTGQIIGVLLMAFLPMFGRDLNAKEKEVSKCDVKDTGKFDGNLTGKTKLVPVDLGNAVLFAAVLAVLVVINFVFMFHTDYKRLRAEKEIEQKKETSTYNAEDSLHDAAGSSI